jgi:hypothetical protein
MMTLYPGRLPTPPRRLRRRRYPTLRRQAGACSAVALPRKSRFLTQPIKARGLQPRLVGRICPSYGCKSFRRTLRNTRGRIQSKASQPTAMSFVISVRYSAVLGACFCLAATLSAFCQEAPGQDPTKFCASIGSDDRVRPIPPGLVPESLRLFYLRPVDPEQVQRSTVYRCMDSAVWLCNYGANLVCAKADVSRVSRGAQRYCRENPGSEVVPMAATGHATIYSWECVGDKPRIKSSVMLDRRGFIANQWKRLEQ